NSATVHTSYLGISAYFIKSLAGISEYSAGYDTILIAPHIHANLQWCRASVETPHGVVQVSWEKQSQVGRRSRNAAPSPISYKITVPSGAKAILRIEGEEDQILNAGEYKY
ncbi:MAG: hypothetical protein LBR18_04870, partial [Tannerella sp.]|nr:hypothetical protein [Tannerella sp.]